MKWNRNNIKGNTLNIFIYKHDEYNNLTTSGKDEIFATVHDVIKIYIECDKKSLEEFCELYVFLNLKSISVNLIKINPSCVNNNMEIILSFLNKYDYNGKLFIRSHEVVNLEKYLNMIPPNIKKLIITSLPKNIPDMRNTILSIRFGAGTEAVDFLEKNIEKIRYLELMFCLIEPPQRFCDIISKSNLRYLKLISAGDANYYDEFYYNTLYASYDFKIMLAKVVRQNTSIVGVKIKEYH